MDSGWMELLLFRKDRHGAWKPDRHHLGPFINQPIRELGGLNWPVACAKQVVNESLLSAKRHHCEIQFRLRVRVRTEPACARS